MFDFLIESYSLHRVEELSEGEMKDEETEA